MLLVVQACLSCSKVNGAIDPALKELDETIATRQRFESEKQLRISRLKEGLSKAENSLVKAEYYSALFDQYKNYQYDSAFVYAKLLESFASGPNATPAYRAKAQIALLHCFKSVGFFNEAVDVIREFDPESVPAPLCAEFYFLCAETWQNLSSYVSGTEVLSSRYDELRLSCYEKVLGYADKDSYLYGYANLEINLI